MPRKSLAGDLKAEETVTAPSSPIRRSTRIAQNSPAPAAIITRRASASTVEPVKTTRARRLSVTQEIGDSELTEPGTPKKTGRATRSASKSPSVLESDHAPATPKPRTRRGSVSKVLGEDAPDARAGTPTPKNITSQRRSNTVSPSPTTSALNDDIAGKSKGRKGSTAKVLLEPIDEKDTKPKSLRGRRLSASSIASIEEEENAEDDSKKTKATPRKRSLADASNDAEEMTPSARRRSLKSSEFDEDVVAKKKRTELNVIEEYEEDAKDNVESQSPKHIVKEQKDEIDLVNASPEPVVSSTEKLESIHEIKSKEINGDNKTPDKSELPSAMQPDKKSPIKSASSAIKKIGNDTEKSPIKSESSAFKEIGRDTEKSPMKSALATKQGSPEELNDNKKSPNESELSPTKKPVAHENQVLPKKKDELLGTLNETNVTKESPTMPIKNSQEKLKEADPIENGSKSNPNEMPKVSETAKEMEDSKTGTESSVKSQTEPTLSKTGNTPAKVTPVSNRYISTLKEIQKSAIPVRTESKVVRFEVERETLIITSKSSEETPSIASKSTLKDKTRNAQDKIAEMKCKKESEDKSADKLQKATNLSKILVDEVDLTDGSDGSFHLQLSIQSSSQYDSQESLKTQDNVDKNEAEFQEKILNTSNGSDKENNTERSPMKIAVVDMGPKLERTDLLKKGNELTDKSPRSLKEKTANLQCEVIANSPLHKNSIALASSTPSKPQSKTTFDMSWTPRRYPTTTNKSANEAEVIEINESVENANSPIKEKVAEEKIKQNISENSKEETMLLDSKFENVSIVEDKESEVGPIVDVPENSSGNAEVVAAELEALLDTSNVENEEDKNVSASKVEKEDAPGNISNLDNVEGEDNVMQEVKDEISPVSSVDKVVTTENKTTESTSNDEITAEKEAVNLEDPDNLTADIQAENTNTEQADVPAEKAAINSGDPKKPSADIQTESTNTEQADVLAEKEALNSEGPGKPSANVQAENANTEQADVPAEKGAINSEDPEKLSADIQTENTNTEQAYALAEKEAIISEDANNPAAKMQTQNTNTADITAEKKAVNSKDLENPTAEIQVHNTNTEQADEELELCVASNTKHDISRSSKDLQQENANVDAENDVNEENESTKTKEATESEYLSVQSEAQSKSPELPASNQEVLLHENSDSEIEIGVHEITSTDSKDVAINESDASGKLIISESPKPEDANAGTESEDEIVDLDSNSKESVVFVESIANEASPNLEDIESAQENVSTVSGVKETESNVDVKLHLVKDFDEEFIDSDADTISLGDVRKLEASRRKSTHQVESTPKIKEEKNVPEFVVKRSKRMKRESLYDPHYVQAKFLEENELVSPTDVSYSSSEDEQEEKKFEFLDDMAEEVEEEEDTSSIGSNDIVDEGESLHSTDSDNAVHSSDDTYDRDSFIDDDEIDHAQLLSGDEYDLGDEMYKTKSIEILESDSDIEVIQEVPPTKRRSRIIRPPSSSSEASFDEAMKEIMNTSNTNKSIRHSLASIRKEHYKREADSSDALNEFVDANNATKAATIVQETSTFNLSNVEDDSDAKRKSNKRKSSITIQENVRVADIEDGNLSERITKVVDWFYSGLKQTGGDLSGNVSLNVSLDYGNSPDAPKNNPAEDNIPIIQNADASLNESRESCKSTSASSNKQLNASQMAASFSDKLIPDIHNLKNNPFESELNLKKEEIGTPPDSIDFVISLVNPEENVNSKTDAAVILTKSNKEKSRKSMEGKRKSSDFKVEMIPDVDVSTTEYKLATYTTNLGNDSKSIKQHSRREIIQNSNQNQLYASSKQKTKSKKRTSNEFAVEVVPDSTAKKQKSSSSEECEVTDYKRVTRSNIERKHKLTDEAKSKAVNIPKKKAKKNKPDDSFENAVQKHVKKKFTLSDNNNTEKETKKTASVKYFPKELLANVNEPKKSARKPKRKCNSEFAPSVQVVNSNWLTESAIVVKPSKKNKKSRSQENNPMSFDVAPEAAHKDFKSELLYDSSRTKRIQTKTLLKKKQKIKI